MWFNILMFFIILYGIFALFLPIIIGYLFYKISLLEKKINRTRSLVKLWTNSFYGIKNYTINEICGKRGENYDG